MHGFVSLCLMNVLLVQNVIGDQRSSSFVHDAGIRMKNDVKFTLDAYNMTINNLRKTRNAVDHGAILCSNGTALLKIDLGTLENSPLFSGLDYVSSIDYDVEDKIVVFSDNFNVIYSANIEPGSEKQLIVEDKKMKLFGLAVDWIHNNIYWIDYDRHTISVASMDGKYIKVLFETDNGPMDIVVDPFKGWMFWTEFRNIKRAGMDGTQRIATISEIDTWHDALAIDYVEKKLFWILSKSGTFYSSDYDGMQSRIILNLETASLNTFVLDVFEDWLYWWDRNSKIIYKADKNTGRNVQTVVSEKYISHFKVFHSSKQPNGTNYCGPRNGNCSHLCLPAPQVAPESAMFTCACPDGMVLTANKKTCQMAGCNCTENEVCDLKNEVLTCSCPKFFQKFNNNCLECDCGSDSTCDFQDGRKTCRCLLGYVDNNGTCEECFCGDGHICGIVGSRKVCICMDKFEDNNGTCEECDCGPGHSCEFQNGIKTCRCYHNHADNNGICKECSCGGNYSCVFERGKKTCLCPEHYVDNGGKCKECSCGKKSSCIFIAGKKVCLCKYGAVERNGKCEECSCGERHACAIMGGKKICVCMDKYQDNNGTCEECDCGSDNSCEFRDGRKTCIFLKNPSEKEGHFQDFRATAKPTPITETEIRWRMQYLRTKRLLRDCIKHICYK